MVSRLSHFSADSTFGNYDTDISFISTSWLGSMYRLPATFYSKYDLRMPSQRLVWQLTHASCLLVVSDPGRLPKTRHQPRVSLPD